jgi:nucleoside-diphosphate-sugar epimerase
VTRIHARGRRPEIGLADGIAQTYRWFTEQSAVRV